MRVGGVPERSNGAALKAVGRASAPWVRIPPPPPVVRPNRLTAGGFGLSGGREHNLPPGGCDTIRSLMVARHHRAADTRVAEPPRNLGSAALRGSSALSSGSSVATLPRRSPSRRQSTRSPTSAPPRLDHRLQRSAHCLVRPGDCTSVGRSRASRLAAGHTTAPLPGLCWAGCAWSVPLSSPYRPLWHAPGPLLRVVRAVPTPRDPSTRPSCSTKRRRGGGPQAVGDAPSISAGDERNGAPSDGVATRSIDRARGLDLPER